MYNAQRSWKSHGFLFVFLFGLFGCEPRVDLAETEQQDIEEVVFPEQIPSNPVSGTLQGSIFLPDRALLEAGNLTIRQGEEFFPDKAVTIIIWGDEPFENRIIDTRDKDDIHTPHLRFERMEGKSKIPSQKSVTDNFHLLLKFGEREELGISYKINLIHKGSDTEIGGEGFATFENIHVKDGEIDRTSDNLDTLELLAKKYVSQQIPGLEVKESYGTSIHHSKPKKEGFIGFEATNMKGETEVVKIQLVKDETGWNVARRLENNRLHQAHSLNTNPEGSERTIQGSRVTALSANHVEQYLNKAKLIHRVRETHTRCNVGNKSLRANCRTSYKIKVGDDKECKVLNYLLVRDNDEWKIERELGGDERIDLNAGELIERPAYSFYC